MEGGKQLTKVAIQHCKVIYKINLTRTKGTQQEEQVQGMCLLTTCRVLLISLVYDVSMSGLCLVRLSRSHDEHTDNPLVPDYMLC